MACGHSHAVCGVYTAMKTVHVQLIVITVILVAVITYTVLTQ